MTTTTTSTTTTLDEKATVPSIHETNEGKLHDSSSSSSLSHKKELNGNNDGLATAKDDGEATKVEGVGEDKEPVYPTGLPFWLIIFALCLAVFVLAIDNTIIATAIPKITDRFNSLDDVAWYASSYMLTTGCFQLLFGRLYATFSTKWIFIIAISIFEFGSLICGATPSSIGLIVGRAIAGMGAAGIMSGAILILAEITPVAERAAYMGLVGGMWGIASVAGPLLGGVFTDNVTWRLCFYINLPIGAITIVAIIFIYHEVNNTKQKPVGWKGYLQSFDPTGNLVLIPAVVCLFLALQWGGTTYAWSNGRIIGLFVVFGILITIFIFLQFRAGDNAMVPPRLLKMRPVWAANAFNFCIAASFFILAYYVPIWFQAVKGETAVRSGILNLPLILGLVVASMIAGGGTTGFGYFTPFLYISTVLIAIGTGMLTTWEVDTGGPAFLGWQAMAGIGMGFGLQIPFICVQTVLTPQDLPMGTAVIVFSQTIGGAVFVAIGQNIFTNKLVENLKIYAPDVKPFEVLFIGATRIYDVYEGAELAGVIKAYNEALTRVFLISTIIGAMTVFGSVCMPWINVKGQNKPKEEETGTAGIEEKQVEDTDKESVKAASVKAASVKAPSVKEVDTKAV